MVAWFHVFGQWEHVVEDVIHIVVDRKKRET
jgi:hypothetical protein